MKKALSTAGRIATIAVLGLGTTAAFAHPHGTRSAGGSALMIPVENAAGIASCLLPQMDRNGDGLIDQRTRQSADQGRASTLAEMQANTAARFANLDRNSDGVLDEADREIAMSQRAECMALIGVEVGSAENERTGERGNQGRNGPGHKSLSRGPGLALVLQGVDREILPGLDLPALTEVITTQLTTMDANDDGVVSGDELPQRGSRGHDR